MGNGTPSVNTDKSLYRQIQLRLAGAWDVLWDTIVNYQNNGDFNQAAAIALYAILSFIPLFILTFLMIGEFFGTNPAIKQELMEGIRYFNPYFSGDLLRQIGQIEQKKQLLGWVGIVSLIWFSSMIFGAMETAFNLIFRSKTIRNYILSKLLGIAMIPLGWAVATTSMAITAVATVIVQQPYLANELPLLPLIQGFFFRIALPYLITVAFFTLVYTIIPPVKVKIGAALAGAAIFAALLEPAKHFFAWYLANYTRYNVIFGDMEAIVIILVWIFYVALIFLFCAELIASYQRRDLLLLEKTFLNLGKTWARLDDRLFRKFGRMYPAGACIFAEGDMGTDLYYILVGKVRMETSVSQVKKVLAELGPGTYFGEMASLNKAPRSASAYAVEDSEIAIIDEETFHRLLRESDSISLYMLKEFASRIKYTDEVLNNLSHSWVMLMVVLFMLLKWTPAAKDNFLHELAGCLGKEDTEIEDVMKELNGRGILTFENGYVIEFAREKAWDLLNGLTCG
jgi:membrane protein